MRRDQLPLPPPNSVLVVIGVLVMEVLADVIIIILAVVLTEDEPIVSKKNYHLLLLGCRVKTPNTLRVSDTPYWLYVTILTDTDPPSGKLIVTSTILLDW